MGDVQQEKAPAAKKGSAATISRIGKAAVAIGDLLNALSNLLDTYGQLKKAVQEVRRPTTPTAKPANAGSNKDEK